MKKLLPPHLFLASILLAVIIAIVVPQAGVSAWPWNLAGILPVIGGLWLSIIGSRLFARIGTNINPLNSPDKLVVTGPFAYTRNPMYLGFVLALVGIAILLANPLALMSALAFFLVIQFRFIPMEEAACTTTFGADYEAYCQRVRRWL